MASFLSTMTEIGSEMITKFLTSGQELLLVRAAAGDGVANGEKNKITGLVNPISVDISLGDKSYVESTPSYMVLPVYISNKGLTESAYIREVIIYGLDEDGTEFPFSYSWLDGVDTDNILPATKMENGKLDTAHIHDVVILATDQESAAVRVEVGGGNWVTEAQMEAYAVKRPKADGTAGQFLQRTANGTRWAEVEKYPDFDNLLMWPGCVRATPPKNGDTWVEKIVTKADKSLRAERITVRGVGGDYTETYRFYYEDGVTLKESYIVHTTQEEDGTWYEDITREVVQGFSEGEQTLKPELSPYERGAGLYALIGDELRVVANAENTDTEADDEYMVFRLN